MNDSKPIGRIKRRGLIKAGVSLVAAPALLDGGVAVAQGTRRTAPAGGSFEPITSATTEHAALEFASFGIMFGENDLPAANKDKLAIRYPVGPGGTVYPAQTNAVVTRGDGTTSVGKCTISVQMPAGYARGAPFEIGVDATVERPAAPAWSLADARFRLLVSMIHPCTKSIVWVGQPRVGDVVRVTVNGTTITRTVDRNGNGDGLATQSHGWWRQLAVDVQAQRAKTGVRISKHGQEANQSSPAMCGFWWQYLNAGTIEGSPQPFTATPAMLFFNEPVADGANPANFTLTASVTNAAGSSFSLAVRNHTAAAAREAWAATFTDARRVPHVVLDGANRWQDGFLTREEIYEVPLRRVADGAAHPDLKILMGARKNRAGGYDYHWTKVMNCECDAAITRWWWYDADIEIGGAVVARHRDLQHDKWKWWVWHPAWKVTLPRREFYESRKILPRFRVSSIAETPANLNLIRNVARGEYAEPGKFDISLEALNLPLYQGSMNLTTSGGADPRKSHTSGYEVAAIQMYTPNGWRALEPLAENCIGAWPHHVLHGVNHLNFYADGETPTPGSRDFPNDYQLAWESHASGKKPVQCSGATTAGFQSFGVPGLFGAHSHFVSTQQYVPILRGEYHDLHNIMSTNAHLILDGPSSRVVFENYRHPQEGIRHRIGMSSINGLRSVAWPFRHRIIAKANCPDSSPYRAYLTRLLADGANGIRKIQESNKLRMIPDQISVAEQRVAAGEFGHRDRFWMTYGTLPKPTPHDGRVNAGTWMMNYLIHVIGRGMGLGETADCRRIFDYAVEWLQGPYVLKHLSQVPGKPIGGAVRHWSAYAVIYGGIFQPATQPNLPGPFNDFAELLNNFYSTPSETVWESSGGGRYQPYLSNKMTTLASVLANPDSGGQHSYIAMYHCSWTMAQQFASDATLRGRCVEMLRDVQTDFARRIPSWNGYGFDLDPAVT